MTISHKFDAKRCIKTLLNLSTRKRSFMVLWNPDQIQREFWDKHLSVFGLSLVYFSLDSDMVTFDIETEWAMVHTTNGLFEVVNA